MHDIQMNVTCTRSQYGPATFLPAIGGRPAFATSPLAHPPRTCATFSSMDPKRVRHHAHTTHPPRVRWRSAASRRAYTSPHAAQRVSTRPACWRTCRRRSLSGAPCAHPRQRHGRAAVLLSTTSPGCAVLTCALNVAAESGALQPFHWQRPSGAGGGRGVRVADTTHAKPGRVGADPMACAAGGGDGDGDDPESELAHDEWLEEEHLGVLSASLSKYGESCGGTKLAATGRVFEEEEASGRHGANRPAGMSKLNGFDAMARRSSTNADVRSRGVWTAVGPPRAPYSAGPWRPLVSPL
jgi:hypothetical protein